MARLKPRTGIKRQATPNSDSVATGSTSQDINSQPSQEQQQDLFLSLLDAAGADSKPAVQDSMQYVGHQELPEPLPRARSRKRKPSAPVGATSEPEAAAAADHSSKRTRRGGTDNRGLYRELNDSDFDYDWASSESEGQVSADVDEDDGHEHFCSTCGGKEDEERLLLCEHCPRIYHLYCLDPPLSKVPKGDWLCPYCQKADDLLHDQTGLEKVLAVRTREDASGSKQQQQEFYIKWKDKSYIHCSWISESVVNAAASWRVVGQANPVAARLRKFWQQQSAAAETREFEEAEEMGQLVNGINPAWLQVDKVLASRHFRGGDRVEYLVSWKELPLEQASWEAEQDLADFSAELAAFKSSQTPIAADAAARKRAQAAAAAADSQQQTGIEVSAAASMNAYDSSGAGAAALGGDSARGAGSRKFEVTPDFVEGGVLHPYQLEGLNWLYHKAQSRHNAILADEMGLGKTIQAIAFMGALWKDCVPLPHLVVVPLTTISNWERELSIWAPYLRVVSLKGTAAARQLLLDHCFYAPAEGQFKGRTAYQDRVKFHVLLTTYEMVSKHLAQLQRLDWGALIVDEAHRLKNATSRLFQDLMRVNACHRLLLTGTPLQNNLDELFFLMNFLEPRKFPSVDVFRETYAALDDKDKVGELHRQLKPHLLRRLKKDVLKQLPPKMEQMVRVELSDEQRELYKAILSRNYDALVDKSKGVVRLRNVMMELRKTVNHPCLLGYDIDTPAYNAAVARRTAAAQAAADAAARAAAVDPSAPVASETTEQLIAASGKLSLLDKMMLKLKSGGHRVLIYSQFTRTLDVLEDWVMGRGWGYERIDGDVSGAERQKRVDNFNSQPDRKFVFLLSTRAGGLGINLATADTVVIYDSDWNPHNDLQALARAHRMGQTSSVMVFRLVTRNTIEERMLQRAKSKMVLEHLIVAKAAKSDKLAQEELDDILRYGAKDLFAEEEVQEHQDTQSAAAAEAAEAAGAVGSDKTTSDQLQQQQHKRMRIVYDDAAIDRLLDRSQVAAAAAAAAKEEGEDDEFTKAFKVANFDMVEQQEEPAAEQQQPEAAGQQQTDTDADDALVYDPAATELHKSQQQFWAAILGERPADQQGQLGLATQELRQRRARQAARYIFYDSESDTESGQSDRQQAAAAAVAGLSGAAGAGKGRRKRKRQVGVDDDELYQADEHESESEDIHNDAEAEGRLNGEQHADNTLQHTAAANVNAGHVKLAGTLGPAFVPRPGSLQPVVAVVPHPVTNQHQAAQQQSDVYPVRVTGGGALLHICGLCSTERHTFLSVLMHFGPPHIHSKPDLGWQPYEQNLKSKTRKQLESYLLVFLEHLQDVSVDGDSSHGSRDCLPHSFFFVGPKGQVAPNRIWERIATLQLLAQKIWSHGNKPADMFVCGGHMNTGGASAPTPGTVGVTLSGKKAVDVLYKQLSSRVGGWGPAQDYSLVRGVFIVGFDSWSKILAMTALNIKRPLRTELDIPSDYDTPETLAAVTAAAEVETLPEGVTRENYIRQHVAQHQKQGNNYRRRELEWLDKRVKAIVNALRVEFSADAQQRQQQVQQGGQHGPHPGVVACIRPQQQPLQRKDHPGQVQPQRSVQNTQQPAARVQQQGVVGWQQQQQQQQPPMLHTSAPSSTWPADVTRLYQHMKQQLTTIKAQASQALKNEQADGQGMKNAAEQFRDNVQLLQQHAHKLELVMMTLLPQPTTAPQPTAVIRGGQRLPAGATTQQQQQQPIQRAPSDVQKRWHEEQAELARQQQQQQQQRVVPSTIVPAGVSSSQAAHVPMAQQLTTPVQPAAAVMHQSAAPHAGGQQQLLRQHSGQSLTAQAEPPATLASITPHATVASAAMTANDVIVLD